MLPLLLLCLGCPFPWQDGGIGTGQTTATTEPGGSPFDQATALSLGLTDTLQFRGSIKSGSDIGLYNLGELTPGDRLVVDVQRTSGNLDPVAAIFDSQQEIVAYNDDHNPDSSDVNPRLDIVLRGQPGTYYLGIIAYPGNSTTGDYTATVRVQRGGSVPPPQAQVVYLNWHGGSDIVVRNVGVFNLPPFSATDVGLPAEQTAALKERVRAIIQQRYAGYNLIVLSSDQDAPPSLAHSTVYYGGRNYEAFAISEAIDTFNENPSDNTIVFTQSFLHAFRQQPTLEEMATALGNTTAHEIGHLLGLVHTADCDDLMDTTCSNDRILQPQAFKTARLDRSIFPFGLQDAAEILGWLLGLVGM